MVGRHRLLNDYVSDLGTRAQMTAKGSVKSMLTVDPIVAALSTLEANFDAQKNSIEKMASAVDRIASDLNRKIDETEHDFSRKLETFNTSVQTQFQSMGTKWDTASQARDAELRTFVSKLQDERRAESRAPYGLMLTGALVILALVGGVGKIVIDPMGSNISRIETTLDKMVDSQIAMREFLITGFVSQKDLDARTARGAEDRDRTNRIIEKIQENVFPKAVHEQRWLRFDSDIAATNLRMDTLIGNLQREIDVIQKSLGDTYNTRDALLEGKERMTKLEELIREIMSRRVTMP